MSRARQRDDDGAQQRQHQPLLHPHQQHEQPRDDADDPRLAFTIPLKPPAPASTNEGYQQQQQQQRPLLLLRHDSTFSVGTEYDYDSPNNLTVLQGAVLLTADCLGTGLLALPGDMDVLGWAVGLGFLILNLPINLYAGTIFHYAAAAVEARQDVENELYYQSSVEGSLATGGVGPSSSNKKDYRTINADSIDSIKGKLINYKSINSDTVNSQISVASGLGGSGNFLKPPDYRAINEDTVKSIESAGAVSFVTTSGTDHAQFHHDTATFDFIGMTRAVFVRNKNAAKCVTAIYYTNIFLVLGNYILVMSHAVSAAFSGTSDGSSMCYPTAGLIASIGMFVVSQSRTMAKLGRLASFLSLMALMVVVVQCLWAANYHAAATLAADISEQQGGALALGNATAAVAGGGGEGEHSSEGNSLLRKLSALGSIGFAVGSQKLFLNIRHELADRSTAPRCLAYSLSAFGAFYVLIVLTAGTHPPSFLFDAIAPGIGRRVAGFFLWAHVVVSYAINSQAICSSMDRLVAHRLRWCSAAVADDPSKRWMLLTGIMAVAAYTVANAVPFFKDLVSLIGALTSVPLTLLLPAIFWRKHLAVPLWLPTRDSIWSYALTVFSVIFLVAASIGSFYSIELDWSSHGAPFSCH